MVRVIFEIADVLGDGKMSVSGGIQSSYPTDDEIGMSGVILAMVEDYLSGSKNEDDSVAIPANYSGDYFDLFKAGRLSSARRRDGDGEIHHGAGDPGGLH